MQHDSPNPIKKKFSLSDRLLKNPITSLIGVLLIAGSIYMLKHELDNTYAIVLGGAGLFALGLKDKS